MGTKRIGLARVQALIENLKRELQLNNATITGTKSKVITVDDARVVTAAESGSTLLWTKDSAHHITLPAAEAGLNYKIVVKVSSNNEHKIIAQSGDCFFGKVVVRSSNATHDSAIQEVAYATATADPGDYDHLKIRGNQTDTGSGVGSVIELECIDGVAWRVTADLVTSNGSPASIATIYAG